MEYGYFDDQNREYVITNSKTPVKWINYVGTLAFGGIVDHTGGALICRNDPALNRITKYIPQLPSSSFKGTTLYLRLKEAEGQYRIFSPYFVPTLDAYDRYECRVGLGYTRICHEFAGIRTEVTIFVPIGAEQVVRDICITNTTGDPVCLDVIPVVEYTHPDALKQFTNADWVPQTMQSKALRQPGDEVILIQYPFMNRDRQVNFFTSNWPVSSFETDRARFLGDNEYGTWAQPLALQQPELGDYEALRGDNIAALMHHLDEVHPGETARLITQLGQTGNIVEALPSIERYRDPAQVDAALDELAAFWDVYLGRLQVQTPSASMDRMVNVYNARQCHTTLNWSRYLSLYQLGLGARGIGFRDSSQDAMGIVSSMPGTSKAMIQKLLHVQRRDGSAYHQFNPLSMVASEGDAGEEGEIKYYSDDHLWAVLATCAYLKETGDLTFLDEVIPYYDQDGEDQTIESGTVLDHLWRGLEFTTSHLGQHGLPLAGFADWNDSTNLPPGAESLFTANLYGVALRELIELAWHLDNEALAARLEEDYRAMRDRVNECAWDGEWYVRYFDPRGEPLGSVRCEHGQIYTNGQSWPVLSGFAPPERALCALDAVREHLNTPNGIKLSTPGFNGFDPEKGGVTTYPPGTKENGGIFLHANPWVMIAETMVGRGGQAFEYYDQINPAAKNDVIDEFECEPYAYPQNILADEHPQFGLARNSWLSGTASWCYQAATKYILGIRPTYEGLCIDPCIPTGWDRFQVRRVFRDAVYEIEVLNPDGVSKGVRSVSLDGTPIEGNVAPVLVGTHQIRVVMG